MDDFCETLQKLGHMAEVDVLRDIFSVICTDGDGTLGIAELFRWMTGVRRGGSSEQAGSSTITAKEVTLRLRRSDEEVPLDEMSWTPDALRRELQYALLRNGLTPLELVSAYDKDGDRSFGKREFLRMMKLIVDDMDLWDGALRLTVQETFSRVGGSDQNIDLNEFQEWLSKGWQDRKDEPGAQPTGGKAEQKTTQPSGKSPSGGKASAGRKPSASSTRPAAAGMPAAEAADSAPASDEVVLQPTSAPAPAPSALANGRHAKGPSAAARPAPAARAPPRRVLSQQEVERMLRDSEVRLAKALMDASMVLGDEGLTANQQAELRTMRERAAASLADAARGGGGKEKASPLRTDRPRSSHQNGSPARSKPTTPLSLAASIDAVTPSRSASVSANLIELTRQVRYPQLHDPWNGRNGPPPRRLPRAGSAPPIAMRRPLDSTMPLAAPHLKSTATVEQIFNSSPFAFGSLAKFDKRNLKALGLRPS